MSLVWDQVNGVTAKKFIPKAIDNIFDSNPFYERMKRKNLMKLDGGDSIMQPLAYAETSSSDWYEGADSLNTADNEQLTSAQYDWRFLYANMTIKRTDELKNSGEAQKVSLARQKVELAEKTMSDKLGTALWNNGSAAKALHGVRHILSASNTVGGINQSTNSWWASNIDSSSTVVALSAFQTQFTAATIGAESPTLGLCTRTIYDLYYNLLSPQQRFMDDGTAKAGFSSLMFNGIPIIADSHAPASHLVFLDERYIKLIAHKDEFMRFEPFLKPINQNVRSGKIYFAGQLCSSQNRKHALFTALAS